MTAFDPPAPGVDRHRLSRRAFLGSATVAGTMGLSGCSSLAGVLGNPNSTAATTVQFWTLFSGGDGAAMKSIVERFNDEQPLGDVRIERQRIPWNEYYTKLYTALVADTGPDIAIMHQALMSRFQAMLDPFDDYLPNDSRSQYVPTLYDRMTVDDQQLALPLDAHPIGIYYNRSLFESAGLDPDAPPTDFDSFRTACDAIVSETDAHAFASALDPIGMLRTFIAVLNQRGGSLLSDDRHSVAFDSDAGLATAQLFANNTGEYGWDVPNADNQRARVAFRDNNLAMIVNGSWYAAVCESIDGFDWGAFKPFIAPDKQRDVTESGSHAIVLPRNPTRSEETTRTAVATAEWITQNNPIWGTTAGHLPAATDALHSDALRDSPLWPKSISIFSEMANDDQFAYLPRAPFNVNEGSTWDFLGDIYAHTVSPEAGISRGAETVQGVIDDVK